MFEATDRDSAQRPLSRSYHRPELSRRDRAAVPTRFDLTGPGEGRPP
ncbi:hypothetical protein O7632_27430 [Solwaraspora sp. WMMD406]|nr:hypothetical protein [Solwaraspora sp. WMMD406]MDG4767797.1 hypothetical protein [Solwaraspora sp. WMMD406]